MWNLLEPYLLNCPFKIITNWDCPGCGFQRSLIALFKGELRNSYNLYPATIPILLLSMGCIIDACFGLDKSGLIIKLLIIISAVTVITSYIIKLITHN